LKRKQSRQANTITNAGIAQLIEKLATAIEANKEKLANFEANRTEM
jgi:hypothetical protein